MTQKCVIKLKSILISVCVLAIALPLLDATLYFDRPQTKVIYKRQTVVSSDANANGKGEKVDTDATSEHYKNSDGVIGVNTSSKGDATGTGQTGINNQVYGSAGGKEVSSVGNVGAIGQNSESQSQITAGIKGDVWNVDSFQHGKATGVGDTGAASNGNIQMIKDGVQGQYSNNNSQSSAGATGSLSSSSEIVSSQILSFDSILAQLVGSSVAQGLYNAQANVDLSAGSKTNGIENNGVVSGDNKNGGLVNAQVNSNAILNNTQHELLGNMYGSVNGTGTSNLVGASNLQSNSSGKTTSIQSFGDGKVSSDGLNNMNLNSNTNATNSGGTFGNMHLNSTANGNNTDMTLSGGLKAEQGNTSTMGLGDGSLISSGNKASNSSMTVNSNMNPSGDANLIVNADGQAQASNNTATLNMNSHGNVSNSDGIQNLGSASGNGQGQGEKVNVTGNTFLNLNTADGSGNSMMGAQAEGKNASSAATNANLVMTDASGNNRTSNVSGSVKATGDNTKVTSYSVATDNNGITTLVNQQTSKSSGKGSSSSSASASGIL
uniref:Autotransporter domain-containing protein n=1 Tax=Rhabditophanes sp. KR3021 TaxID=114890 RepID=A0AC35TKH3_9BILA